MTAPAGDRAREEVLVRHDLTHPDGRAFAVYGPLQGALDDQPAHHDVDALHLRYDLLTATWVLVSPARNTRPGGLANTPTPDAGSACPLCPGGVELPFPYDGAVFDNRFPALSPFAPDTDAHLFAPSIGRCQVVVYTSDHEGSLSTLPPSALARVIAMWRDRTATLWSEGHAYVMAFENHGAEIGATLTHPHGQLYAFPFVPPVTVVKLEAARSHRSAAGTCLACELVDGDAGSDRELFDGDTFTVTVPFAARWPYEVHLRARRHGCRRLGDLTAGEALDLAKAIRGVVRRYDGLFGFELPYLLCVQEAPDEADDWHLHVELLPPHRDPRRLKVRASVETALGVFINDTLPELTAQRLREVAVDAESWAGVLVPEIRAERT